MDSSEISNYWRLCNSFTLKQAALLIVGVDPDSEIGVKCEELQPHERPKGYGAIKQALSLNLRGPRSLQIGTNVKEFRDDPNGGSEGGGRFADGTTDINSSTVYKDLVNEWLEARGIRTGFFFPDTAMKDTPGYLDPGHPRFAPKLAAAVHVWQAMEDENLRKKGKAISDMTAWLESRYKELGLVYKQEVKSTKGEVTHKVGDRNGGAITQICKVANWDEGGAPKTPSN